MCGKELIKEILKRLASFLKDTNYQKGCQKELNNGIFYVKNAVLLVYPVMDSESGYVGIVENNGLKINIEIHARH